MFDHLPILLCFLSKIISTPAPRGPGDLPGGPGEMERSGGPHSDSGSNSPTWDRDRRGPPPGAPPPGVCHASQKLGSAVFHCQV